MIHLPFQDALRLRQMSLKLTSLSKGRDRKNLSSRRTDRHKVKAGDDLRSCIGSGQAADSTEALGRGNTL